MSVTQYIGARYVPLFADPYDWDDTREYEPLTVVLSNGNSYTSKQYVPKGIPPTNENYWALTGNYNAQIEQYRKETNALSNKYDTVAKNSSDALSLAQTNKRDIAANDAELAGTAESGLKTLITNETERAKAEESKLSESNKTLKQTVDNHTGLIAANTNANTKHESQLAGTLDSGLKDLIDSKFPIAAGSVADGAITAPKLAISAISSILQGFTVRRFDSTDSKADNTGMVCPEGGKLIGFYIVELGILAINVFEGTAAQNGETTFSLPSYVPSVSGSLQLSAAGVIGWSSTSNFANWTSLMYGKGRHIYPHLKMNLQFSSTFAVGYLKPYEISGQAANYENAIASNQII